MLIYGNSDHPGITSDEEKVATAFLVIEAYNNLAQCDKRPSETRQNVYLFQLNGLRDASYFSECGCSLVYTD